MRALPNRDSSNGAVAGSPQRGCHAHDPDLPSPPRVPLAVFVKGTRARPAELVRPDPTFTQVLVPAAKRCRTIDAPEAATVGEVRFVRSRTVTVAAGRVPYAKETAPTEAVRHSRRA